MRKISHISVVFLLLTSCGSDQIKMVVKAHNTTALVGELVFIETTFNTFGKIDAGEGTISLTRIENYNGSINCGFVVEISKDDSPWVNILNANAPGLINTGFCPPDANGDGQAVSISTLVQRQSVRSDVLAFSEPGDYRVRVSIYTPTLGCSDTKTVRVTIKDLPDTLHNVKDEIFNLATLARTLSQMKPLWQAPRTEELQFEGISIADTKGVYTEAIAFAKSACLRYVGQEEIATNKSISGPESPSRLKLKEALDGFEKTWPNSSLLPAIYYHIASGLIDTGRKEDAADIIESGERKLGEGSLFIQQWRAIEEAAKAGKDVTL